MTTAVAAPAQIRDLDPDRSGELEAITAIYAHHVLTGTASFELEPPDAGEMARRFDILRKGNYPMLVAVDKTDARIVGYAYCGPYRSRPAYGGTVEDSVYVHRDATGRGIGRALLAALIERARRSGYLQIMAAIGDSDNQASIGLHRSCGFVEIGTARRIGFKFGRFLDVVYMQRSIADGT